MSDESQIPESAADTPATEPAPSAQTPEPAVATPPLPPPDTSEPVAAAPPPPPTPAWAPPESQDGGALPSAVTDRPEAAVGAAFAGGLVLALILKRLAR